MRRYLWDVRFLEQEAARQIAEAEAEIHAARFGAIAEKEHENEMDAFYLFN